MSCADHFNLGLDTLHKCRVSIDEAKQLQKCYPNLSKNKWYQEQVARLVALSLECAKILERCADEELAKEEKGR